LAKADKGDGAQNLDLLLAVVLAVSLIVPVAFGVAVEQFRAEGLVGGVAADTVLLFCVLLLGVGVSYVLWQSSEKRQVRYTALLAALFLILSQLTNLTEEVAAIKDVPLLGSDSAWNSVGRNFFLYGGLGLFLASFGLALLDGNWIRRLLRLRQEELPPSANVLNRPCAKVRKSSANSSTGPTTGLRWLGKTCVR
jgi:hypothetical protein